MKKLLIALTFSFCPMLYSQQILPVIGKTKPRVVTQTVVHATTVIKNDSVVDVKLDSTVTMIEAKGDAHHKVFIYGFVSFDALSFEKLSAMGALHIGFRPYQGTMLQISFNVD